ncbi:MAG: hypothetical protein ACI8UR_001980 [Natronomonas sp.]|jgi:hypothetical protein|uniref:DUF5810 domain-containing protein n=1 Tax=Natronomonas sp. TaxID=2184060 RepID=UPI003988A6BD
MGYACPVCDDPQADAGHLANHLAFTAMLGDDDHEAWLDEHAPDWNEMGEADLAAVVTESVEETEFPQVFEDTVGGLDESSESPSERSGALFDDEHSHAGHDHTHSHDHQTAPLDSSGPTDEETEAILEEAREMTKEMLDEEDANGEADAGGEAEEDAESDKNE